MDGSGSIPSNPMGLRLAQAYGVRPEPVAPALPAPTPKPVQQDAPAVMPNAVTRLVAAVVPGKVEFDADGVPQATKPGASLPFYTRPGDVNAAATGVHAGRSLDVEG